MLAYGNFPYSHTIDQVKEGRNGPKYCLDLIVPQPDSLQTSLRKELAVRFDLQAKEANRSISNLIYSEMMS